MKDAYKIEGMTIAVQNMDAMVKFYSNVFDIQFVPMKAYETTLFAGRWGNFNLLLCPAHIAQNTADQNRHQFDIEVTNIDDIMEKCLEYGGEILSDKDEMDEMITVSVYDPDQNSIVFKTYLVT